MKNLLLKTLFLFSLLLSINSVFALTAISSGNWSSAATWDGPPPGSNVNNTSINIPAGITVNLDMNVVFSGVVNNFNVDGRLMQTGNYGLTMANGSLSGLGDVDVYSITFQLLATSSFTGELNVNRFINQGATLFLSNASNVTDTLDLQQGSIFLNAGSILQMMNNSTLRMDEGNLSIGSGGVFNTQNYSILYVGDSKTSGIELNGSMIRNMTIQLTDNTQKITLASDAIVSGVFDIKQGGLDFTNHTLTIRDQFRRDLNATLTSSATSNLVVESAQDMSDGFLFSTGSELNDLTLNRGTTITDFRLMSDLKVNGDFYLQNGDFSIENSSQLIMQAGSRIVLTGGKIIETNGVFNGSNSYDVEYNGSSRVTGVEFTGSGLNNVGVNLLFADNQLILTTDGSIGGNLRLDLGSANLNGHQLTLNGTINQQAAARIIGGSTSSMILNLESTVDDTIYFDDNIANPGTNHYLQNLTINKVNGGDVVLGSQLGVVNQLNFQKGRLDISNYDLTMLSAATAAGYDQDRYVVTSASGSLKQLITANTAYNTFPVGTETSYSPASVQQAAGSSSGMFSVRAANGVYENATLGTGVNYANTMKLVNRTWFISSENGMNLNTNVRLGWNGTDEVNLFNRNTVFVSHYTNNQWDRSTSVAATAGLNNSFFVERNGFTSLSPFTVMDNAIALGIEKVSASEFEIYPNPANDLINISTPAPGEKVEYALIDITGKVIVSTSNSDKVTRFDLSSLPKGYYMIRTVNAKTNQIVTRKFVKS